MTVGTAFERSHVPLSTWLVVIRRLCESGQALRAYQLHKLVGVSRQSAWLMAQRIREAIAQRCAPARGTPTRELATLTRKSRLSARKPAEPTASAMPTGRLSLTGIPYEEVLASMIERKPPATVNPLTKRKPGTGNHQAGKRAPEERKLIA